LKMGKRCCKPEFHSGRAVSSIECDWDSDFPLLTS
jgi:hypothetical protein